MSTVRKFAQPFRFINGRVATVAQDTEAEVSDCVEAILRTPQGSRVEQPTFGIPDMTFRTNGPDPVPIREAIERDEPRARFTVLADDTQLAERIGRVQVTMQQQTPGGA